MFTLLKLGMVKFHALGSCGMLWAGPRRMQRYCYTRSYNCCNYKCFGCPYGKRECENGRQENN